MPGVFSDIENSFFPSKITVDKNSEPLKVKDSLPSQAQRTENIAALPNDEYVNQSAEKQNTKKGPIKKVKGLISNIKKVYATAAEYSKGTIKGGAAAAVTGSLVYTGGSIINHFRDKAAVKAADVAAKAAKEGKVAETAAKVAKRIPNKFLAFAAAGVAFAACLWNASLNATERKSDIDHRWNGHQNNI